MAKKTKIGPIQKKFQVIENLASLGINTEQRLEKLTSKELLGVESLSFKEIELIGQLMTLKFLTLSIWKRAIAITPLCIFIMTMIYKGLLQIFSKIQHQKAVKVMTRFGIKLQVCS